VLDFQEHLIATMMALEDTYFSMAEKCGQEQQTAPFEVVY
jgi:hypothetical protein